MTKVRYWLVWHEWTSLPGCWWAEVSFCFELCAHAWRECTTTVNKCVCFALETLFNLLRTLHHRMIGEILLRANVIHRLMERLYTVSPLCVHHFTWFSFYVHTYLACIFSLNNHYSNDFSLKSARKQGRPFVIRMEDVLAEFQDLHLPRFHVYTTKMANQTSALVHFKFSNRACTLIHNGNWPIKLRECRSLM